jgi:hypothetical protein
LAVKLTDGRSARPLSAWSYTAHIASPIGLALRTVDALVSSGLAFLARFFNVIHFF